MEKVHWYLSHGAEAVLVVDGDSLALQLHTAAGAAETEVEGGFVLPGLGARISSDGSSLTVDGVPLDI